MTRGFSLLYRVVDAPPKNHPRGDHLALTRPQGGSDGCLQMNYHVSVRNKIDITWP
jgi:hypothetical protein